MAQFFDTVDHYVLMSLLGQTIVSGQPLTSKAQGDTT